MSSRNGNVTDNTVTGCGNCGFRMAGSTRKTMLRGNRADKSGSWGLVIEDDARPKGIKRNRFGLTHRS